MDPLVYTFQPLAIPLRAAFTQASRHRVASESVWATARRGDVVGVGEGCPRTYQTGEDVASALAWLAGLPPIHGLADLDAIAADAPPAAFCAVECATLDVLARLRLKGFGLSIDDFGIGYSSFEQLRRFPFTELKLDRTFVAEACADRSARAVIESSILLARKLGLTTVAEGVETRDDLELLRELGCDELQGYYVARPMAAAEAKRWLRERSPTTRPPARSEA